VAEERDPLGALGTFPHRVSVPPSQIILENEHLISNDYVPSEQRHSPLLGWILSLSRSESAIYMTSHNRFNAARVPRPDEMLPSRTVLAMSFKQQNSIMRIQLSIAAHGVDRRGNELYVSAK
jgi:hypothetical protein